MSTNIFDTMKLKVLFLLNCESSKYIAKLFSLSIYLLIEGLKLENGILKEVGSNESNLEYAGLSEGISSKYQTNNARVISYIY